jgi:hypothetical protein
MQKMRDYECPACHRIYSKGGKTIWWYGYCCYKGKVVKMRTVDKITWMDVLRYLKG